MTESAVLPKGVIIAVLTKGVDIARFDQECRKVSKLSEREKCQKVTKLAEREKVPKIG